MPSLHSTSTISANIPDSAWCSSSALDVDYTSAPPDISAKVNNQSNTNPAYGPAQPFPNPTKDGDMRYIVSNIPFDDFESVIMVAEDVEQTLLRPCQPPCDTPPCTFEIGDGGKKGRGMFALQNLPAGSLILVEHPVLVAPYLMDKDLSLTRVYKTLLHRLPVELCSDFLDLHSGAHHSVEEIIRTNAIQIQLEVPNVPPIPHQAVFLNASRCNHSCGPNAQWEWDTTTFSLYLSAVRPILKGDEITIPYISCTEPRHERQAALREKYGFTCHCPHCSLSSEDAILRSDTTRSALEQFWSVLPSFEGWCLDSTLPDDMLIKLHLDALLMIKQEGLQVLDSERHVDAIAMCYGALADVEMFRAWTERVRDAKVNNDPARALVFAKWLSNPASFPAWGWKKTFCGRYPNVLV